MIIARYLSREIAIAVLAVMIALLGLFAFFDLFAELDEVGPNYKYAQAVGFVMLNTPGRIYELMPIGVLIGAIYAMAQFANNSEFTAMRAAGLGRKEALFSVAALGAFFVVLTFCVGEFLTPPLERFAKQVKAGSSERVAVQLRSGAWIKDSLRDAEGRVTAQRFVNVNALNVDGSLSGVRAFEFDANFRLLSIVSAKTARYVSQGQWKFFESETVNYLESPSAAGDIKISSSSQKIPELTWKSELTPELFGVLVIDPEKMSASRLWQYTRHLQENQQNSDRYEIAMWRKLIYPFVAIVMLVMALPFGYLNARSGGIGYKVSAGVMMGVAFHTLNSLFSHVGLLNTWPAWVAASVPSLFATALALFMLYWVDRA